MIQLTKRQTELAAKLHCCLLEAAKSFALSHKEELKEKGAAIVLKSLALTTARFIAAGSATEEDAQYNAGVFAKDLMATIKALKSKNQE